MDSGPGEFSFVRMYVCVCMYVCAHHHVSYEKDPEVFNSSFERGKDEDGKALYDFLLSRNLKIAERENCFLTTTVGFQMLFSLQCLGIFE